MATTYDISFKLGTNEDDPVLVFWKASLSPGDGAEWQPLSSHDCNGFAIDYFDGFVIGLRHGDAARPLLNAIAYEEFCKGLPQSDFSRANADSLDWGVEDPHRQAYSAFLHSHGLEVGRLDLLQQAVYPLAPTPANLERLGVASRDIPPGAELLVLGDNCD